MKPPILNYEKVLSQIHRISEDYYSVEHSTGGVSFYEYLARQLEPLIQQAKAEVAREMIKEIEGERCNYYPTERTGIVLDRLLQSLKSKWGQK